jgi:DNA-binding NarL/FixJ family response regulator
MNPSADAPPALLLSDDLLFTSRITGTARDLGLVVKVGRSAEALLNLARQQTPRCVLVDLSHPGLVLADLLRQLGEVCTPLPRLVAYGSHVDAETLRAARAAGCDPVLPRSQFVAELPRALPGWLAAVP